MVSGALAAEINATTYALEMTPVTQGAQGIQGQQLQKSPRGLIKATPAMLSAPKYTSLPPEFNAFRSSLDNAYIALQKALPYLSNSYAAYISKRDECINKAYTYDDQQSAGCLPSDSVNLCMRKLVEKCSHTAFYTFWNNSLSFDEHLRNILLNEDGMKNELQKLRDYAKCLRNEWPQKICQ